jgi:hypothetical protein
LRGAHLQSAQSAYQRACIGLTPAEIEQARSFAQSWRPCRPTGPTILGPRERHGTTLVMRARWTADGGEVLITVIG